MISLYPNYLRNQRGGKLYSRFQVTEMIKGNLGLTFYPLGLFGVEKFGNHFSWVA